jgi:hypothetical protein
MRETSRRESRNTPRPAISQEIGDQRKNKEQSHEGCAVHGGKTRSFKRKIKRPRKSWGAWMPDAPEKENEPIGPD